MPENTSSHPPEAGKAVCCVRSLQAQAPEVWRAFVLGGMIALFNASLLTAWGLYYEKSARVFPEVYLHWLCLFDEALYCNVLVLVCLVGLFTLCMAANQPPANTAARRIVYLAVFLWIASCQLLLGLAFLGVAALTEYCRGPVFQMVKWLGFVLIMALMLRCHFTLAILAFLLLVAAHDLKRSGFLMVLLGMSIIPLWFQVSLLFGRLYSRPIVGYALELWEGEVELFFRRTPQFFSVRLFWNSLRQLLGPGAILGIAALLVLCVIVRKTRHTLVFSKKTCIFADCRPSSAVRGAFLGSRQPAARDVLSSA